jgi:PAS domain S-box-containing protein
VSDTSQDPNWLPNELLPDTKAEAVVPIYFGDKVLGVLDVQDNVTNDIFPEDMTLLESLAGQVAISLQNARLLSQAKSFQDQFSLAVEGSNDGIWDWDLRTNQVYFSPRWKAIVGYEEHELTNGFADFEALLHPEDHDRALAAVNDYLSGKIPAYDIEFRFHHKDGSYRWIRARGKALRDDKGAPYRMAGSHTDITEGRTEQQNIAKRAQQQEALNLITQRIQSATTIETALQITARELGRALGQKPTLVTLEPTTEPNKTESAL